MSEKINEFFSWFLSDFLNDSAQISRFTLVKFIKIIHA